MSTMESKQLATMRRLAKAVERVADALESPQLMDGLGEIVQGLTWQDAVLVLSETCKGAESCEEGACPMYEWCQEALGRSAPAPANWVTVEG